MLLIETSLNWNTREAPWGLPVLAISRPSVESTAIEEGKPRTATEATEPPDSVSYSAVMPGRYFRNSPTLPSITSPSESAATTVLMFAAKRCSLMAMAAPSVSRSVATVKASRRTTPAPP